MEQSIKQILESEAYRLQCAAVAREINWKDSKDQYFPDRSVFKKTTEEKVKLANLKHKWLKEMRRQYPDFTKRKAGNKKFRQTLAYGEDI